MVVGKDGAPIYRGRVGGAPAAGGKGAHSVSFDVPPGAVQLKWSVEDEDSYTLDTDTREITVPDLHEPAVTLSTPQVFAARTGIDLQRLEQAPNPVPEVERVFPRTMQLVIRANAYGPGTEKPAVSARLLNRDGDPMRELEVSPNGSSGAAQVQLPLSGLAPGEYLVELLAKGQGGEAKQLVAFKVVS